jgi:hypothetical protein
LEDLKHWCTGWTDWNLILDPTGGPNHAGNLCDANFIADPSHLSGDPHSRTIITQASYWYMGHFSRFLPPGSKRIEIDNSIVTPPVTRDDILNQRLRFNPCPSGATAGRGMTWSYDRATKELVQLGLCMQMFQDNIGILMAMCDGSEAQQWVIEDWNGHKRFANQADTSRCLTLFKTGGPAVGLDPGVDVNAAFMETCDPNQPQAFTLTSVDDKSFPDAFTIETVSSTVGGNCLLPVNADTITFATVAFLHPTGEVSLIAMNKGEVDITFDVYDAEGETGVESITVPRHGIASMWLTHADSNEEQFSMNQNHQKYNIIQVFV